MGAGSDDRVGAGSVHRCAGLSISRALDRVYAALDRLDVRLDHIERVVLRDHGDRIARLEAERG